VLAWPVVEAVVARARAAPVLVGPGPFASILTSRYPAVHYHAWSRGARYALAGALRREHPGAALLLTESFSSALLAALSGARERIGFAGEGRGLLLTRRVPRPTPGRSTPRAREYRLLAEAAGIPVREEMPRLHALPSERDRAARLLQDDGVDPARYAVMAPGASYGPAKRWEPERYAALARRWAQSHGITTLLVGSEEDRDAAGAVAGPAAAAARDWVGRTDLPALVGLLDGARVVASNDSGVMHLAAALERPTVAIFGSTSPAWTSAAAPWVRNLYAAYPCSPCFRRTCPIGYGCLKAVGAGDAIRTAEEFLGGVGIPGRAAGAAGG
jgi:heptosyltransferase-2